jgi:hypothetical protein
MARQSELGHTEGTYTVLLFLDQNSFYSEVSEPVEKWKAAI